MQKLWKAAAWLSGLAVLQTMLDHDQPGQMMKGIALIGFGVAGLVLLALTSKASPRRAAAAPPPPPLPPEQWELEPEATPKSHCEAIGGDHDSSNSSCRLPTGEVVDAWQLFRGEIEGYPGGQPVNKIPPLPRDGVILSRAGYRRAQDSEVTPAMVAAARAALSSPLGTWITYDGFLVGVESHYDVERGWHKGASIFVP